MKASGRNNPCPACGRTKDADCRWNDTTILCHTGTDMRSGDTLTIAGTKWAFIHHKGGFSGVAAVFKPHRERSRGENLLTPNSPKELLSRQAKRHQWSEVLQQFYDAFDAAWNVADFYTATPNQLTAAFAAITDAQAKAAALTPHLQAIWRDCPDLKQFHKLRVEHCLKSIAYMVRDAEDFERLDLGAPRTAAIEAIAGEAL